MLGVSGKRNEVAARLRNFGEDGSPAEFIYGGTECYDQMLVRVLRQIVGKGDLFEILADLIDRPTTRAVQPAPGGFFVCDRCGADVWADAEAVTNYCPMCGAEVVDG